MKALWRHRWLFAALLEREIRNRYIGSAGGLFWAFAHPLLLLGIYTFVFRAVFRVQFGELGEYPFVAFVAVALWPWMAFQEGVQRGTQAIQANASMIKRVAFPHDLLVYSAVSAAFIVHLAGLLLVLITLALFGYGIPIPGLPLAATAIFFLFLLALAMGLMFGAFQVFLRDFDQVLSPIFMVFFYATPILYPISLVPNWIQQVMLANPMVYFIEPIRRSLLYAEGMGGWTTISVWAGTVALLMLARHVFRRLSANFEDFV